MNSDSEIIAEVPAGATSGPIEVTNLCSSLPNGSFDVIYEDCASGASGLYISEYIEGSGNNKAIEIANFTGATVNLDNYQLGHTLMDQAPSSSLNSILIITILLTVMFT
ncbi:MAG: hypothetical protein IPF68_20420 [Bacteroidales bacterium]|nr:hypothetical protein [Bacteroidales bacterium]